MKPLSGKIAVLHIGAAGWAGPIVGALRDAGATVALAPASPGVSPPDADSGADIALGGPFDDDGAVASAVESLVGRYGRLDILVNAPQAELFRPVAGVSDADLRGLFDRNVVSAFRWCRVAARQMARQRSGRIINFVSGLSRRGVSHGAAFAMTQAALDAMTQSLALELAGTGVRVNGVGYGWVEPARRPLEEQQKERLVRFLPLRRKGHPDDLAGLLVYLASDASSFVTGQTIFVDGGAMAHA